MVDGVIKMTAGVTSGLAGGYVRKKMGGLTAARHFAKASIFCLLSFVICPLNAEKLRDPTRPPSMTSYGVSGKAPPSGLKTIIISGSRRAAIIDGRTVELGAKHGNARLIEVNEGSVVLQDARGRKVLTLFPRVKINKNKSRKKEFLVKQPSSASMVRPGEHNPYLTTRGKKPVSEHPKEER